MFKNPFSDEELKRRLVNVRLEMGKRNLDTLLISTPENIFYLTGLDHWGYFAPHLLIIPQDGDMTLITRQMEQVTIENQVRNALFEGHNDHEGAQDLAIRHLNARRFAKPRVEAALEEAQNFLEQQSGKLRIGVETFSAGHSYGFGRDLRENFDNTEWMDCTGMIDQLRQVKSLEEQQIIRDTARITDGAMRVAIAHIRDGAEERDVAAACLSTMTQMGSQIPGFGPFIRPKHRLGEEHTTWGDETYKSGESVFLELSACLSRYHAPMGRLVHIGSIRDEDAKMAENVENAFGAVLGALKPGVLAKDVYASWQQVADDAGLSHYRRHHCGYLVGIGFPPSWTGGNSVTGLRNDSDSEIKVGMTFHILSWMMGTGQGDYFISNTVLLSENGAEVLTKTTHGPHVV